MSKKYKLEKHYPHIIRPEECPICASSEISLAVESTEEYQCNNTGCGSYPYFWSVFSGLHIKIKYKF